MQAGEEQELLACEVVLAGEGGRADCRTVCRLSWRGFWEALRPKSNRLLSRLDTEELGFMIRENNSRGGGARGSGVKFPRAVDPHQ